MSTGTLLDELTAAGVRLSLAGDDLHYQTCPGGSITPIREQIITLKPALLTLLTLQDEIVRAATVARDAFDRQHFDQRWNEWHALQAQETT